MDQFGPIRPIWINMDQSGQIWTNQTNLDQIQIQRQIQIQIQIQIQPCFHLLSGRYCSYHCTQSNIFKQESCSIIFVGSTFGQIYLLCEKPNNPFFVSLSHPLNGRSEKGSLEYKRLFRPAFMKKTAFQMQPPVFFWKAWRAIRRHIIW